MEERAMSAQFQGRQAGNRLENTWLITGKPSLVNDPGQQGNPVGSRGAISRRCSDVVIGTLLGDGCLERNGVNVRLRIDHSVKQSSLVWWKFRELAELNPSAPRIVRRVDCRTGQEHVNLRSQQQRLRY